MANIQFKDNKILFVDNKIAFGSNCCCSVSCPACSSGTNKYLKVNLTGVLLCSDDSSWLSGDTIVTYTSGTTVSCTYTGSNSDYDFDVTIFPGPSYRQISIDITKDGTVYFSHTISSSNLDCDSLGDRTYVNLQPDPICDDANYDHLVYDGTITVSIYTP